VNFVKPSIFAPAKRVKLFQLNSNWLWCRKKKIRTT